MCLHLHPNPFCGRWAPIGEVQQALGHRTLCLIPLVAEIVSVSLVRYEAAVGTLDAGSILPLKTGSTNESFIQHVATLRLVLSHVDCDIRAHDAPSKLERKANVQLRDVGEIWHGWEHWPGPSKNPISTIIPQVGEGEQAVSVEDRESFRTDLLVDTSQRGLAEVVAVVFLDQNVPVNQVTDLSREIEELEDLCRGIIVSKSLSADRCHGLDRLTSDDC